MTLPAARPVYLEVGTERLFGLLHAPVSGRESGTAVLICPPWGWAEVASYRCRRAWAAELAASGHAALRFDLPGSGDSGGTPGDPGRVDAWSNAIAVAARWLRVATGCGRLAVVGLGLGGLLARKALTEGAPIDDLVLWATPPRGRVFVRAERAFSRLQTSQYTLSGEPEPVAQPEGWLESGGFVLSAETIAAIEPLELRTMAPRGLQRALLLDRDGVGADAGVQAQLEQAGVAVRAAPGTGWAAMVSHPEAFAPPVEAFARVGAWLAEARSPGTDPVPVDGESPERVELDGEGGAVWESPITVDCGSGRLFGVLAEPAGGATTDLCAVFLNAGAIRRIGPNRNWVEASRRWAAGGVASLRIDLEAIGDADGDASRYGDVGEFYVPEFVDQVSRAIDALEARGLGPRFMLVGLCSGAYWAFHVAIREQRVKSACLVNSRVLFWDPGLDTQREARKLLLLLQPVWWRKILQGYVSAGRMREVLRTLAEGVRAAAPRVLRRALGRPPSEPPAERNLDGLLDLLRDAETRLVMAFSGDEPLRWELEREGVLARLDRWPNVEVAGLPARDHELRPLAAQRALHALLDSELERAAAAASGSVPAGL